MFKLPSTTLTPNQTCIMAVRRVLCYSSIFYLLMNVSSQPSFEREIL